MPPVFDRSTPVVDFGASARPLRGKPSWVLWPALAYKVLLPAPRASAFNVFQRAILALCSAGVRTPPDVAERLALPLDLVTFVVDQLKGMDLLDGRRCLTHRAARLLADEEEPLDAEDAGWVFVDALSRRLWPRFHRGLLPFVEAKLEQDNLARIERGSVGSRRDVRATVLWPPPGARDEEPPTAYEILRAAKLHRRRERAFARETSDVMESDAPTPGAGELGREAVKRVRLVSPTPEPIFVAAFFVVPDGVPQASWLVTDPCGLGVTEVLRDEARRRAREGRRDLRALLEGLVGEAWHVDADDLAYFLTESVRGARADLACHLGAGVNALPVDVVEHLAEADAKLRSARAHATYRAKDIDDFLGHAFAALEGVLGWLVLLYPDPSVLAALASDASANQRLLQRVAEALGMSTSDRTAGLFAVPRSVVKGALCHGNRTLPGRLAAALLAAQLRDEHPLRAMAAACPEALEIASRLRRLRIDASHDTDSVPGVEEAAACRDELFTLLRALMGAPAPSPAAPVSTSQELGWGRELLLRLRARAEQTVQEDEALEDLPDLRARMIEMHQAALVLELLAASGTVDASAARGRLRDFAVAAAIVLEATVAEIEKVAPSDRRIAADITDDRGENAAQLSRAAAALGFTMTPSGVLPNALSRARADRIRRAAEGHGETLSARVIAQVLTADKQPDHPLRTVAQAQPSFLLDVAALVEVRGHGDEVALGFDEAACLRVMVRDAVGAVLAALA